MNIEIWSATWDDNSGLGSKPFLTEKEAENFLLAGCETTRETYERSKFFVEQDLNSFLCSLDDTHLSTYNIQPHQISTTALWHKILEERGAFGVLYDGQGLFDMLESSSEDNWTQRHIPALAAWCCDNGQGLCEAFYNIVHNSAPSLEDAEKIIAEIEDNRKIIVSGSAGDLHVNHNGTILSRGESDAEYDGIVLFDFNSRTPEVKDPRDGLGNIDILHVGYWSNINGELVYEPPVEHVGP